MPENPFEEDTNGTKKTYWIILIHKLVDLVTAMPEYDNDLSKLQPIAIVWSSMELLFIGMQRATTMEASGQVIGMTAGSICEAFGDDSVLNTSHDDIKAYINSQLGGRSETEDLSAFHLSQFLVQEPVITALTTAFPEVKIYLDIFRNEIGGTYSEFAKILLTNLGSIDTDEQGNVRPDTMNKSLRPLLRGLQGFLSERLEGELVPIIDEYIGDREDLHTYFHEVLLPSLKLTTDVVFDMVINWEDEGTSAGKVLEETLSSVLMMLVGRSVVVTTDVILAKVQEEIKTQFNELADDDDLLDDIVEILPLSDADAEDIKEIIRDTLIIGGDVFGPLPDQTRVNIRELLYQILAPLPANDQDEFLTQLRTRNAIPNPELVQSLAWELVGIAGDNLYNFVILVLQRIAEKALHWLEDAIEEIHQMAQEWISNLEEALSIARAQLVLLIQEIAELVEEVEELFDNVIDNLDILLTDLSSSQQRDAIRDEIADYLVGRVESVITRNPVYKLLPSSVKTLAKTKAKSIAKASFDNDIVDSIWDAIGHVSGELDDMLDDLRDLSPEEGLATQITELVLERIENRITDIFGDDPTIDIEFDIGWSVKIPYTNIRVSYSKTINLGAIELPLSLIMSKVRWVMTHVDAVETRIMQVADTLRNAFLKELDLHRKEEEYSSLESITNAMDRQIKESVSYSRDILVVTPSPGSVYTDNMEITIELTGVPWAFLGLGAQECQRVFIWLNGVEIPIDTFMAEEYGSMSVSPAEGAAPGVVLSPYIADAVVNPNFSGLHGSGSKEFVLPSKSYEPGSLVDHWGMVLPIRIIEPTIKTVAFAGHPPGRSSSDNLSGKSAFHTDSKPVLKDHWASRSVIKSNVTKHNFYRQNPGYMQDRMNSKIAEASGKISGPGSCRTTSSGKVKSFSNAGTQHTGKTGQKIGKKLSRSEQGLLESTISGQHIRLSKDILLSNLDEGINTLVVAIVDGRGQKIQQAVTFIAAEYQQTEKEKKEPKVPWSDDRQKNKEKAVPKRKNGRMKAKVHTPNGLRVIDRNVIAMSMMNHRKAIDDFKRTLFKKKSDPRELVIGKETEC